MRIPGFIIPILMVAALFGGYFLRTAFTQPTTNVAYAGKTSADANAKSTFIVEGLKCKGTAAYFTSMYDSVPGIVGIETFASDHKAVFTYNSNIISVDSIKAIMEGQVPLDDGTSMQAFKCLSVE